MRSSVSLHTVKEFVNYVYDLWSPVTLTVCSWKLFMDWKTIHLFTSYISAFWFFYQKNSLEFPLQKAVAFLLHPTPHLHLADCLPTTLKSPPPPDPRFRMIIPCFAWGCLLYAGEEEKIKAVCTYTLSFLSQLELLRGGEKENNLG